MDVFINFIFTTFNNICEIAKYSTWPLRNIIAQYLPIVADNLVYQGFASSNFGGAILNVSILGMFGISTIILILVLHLIHLVNVVSG